MTAGRRITVLTVFGSKKHKMQRSHSQPSNHRDWMAEDRDRQKMHRLVERVRSQMFHGP